MTLNAKIGVFIDFFLAISGCKTHFKNELRRNHWNRHGQAAHEIFKTERRFRRSKSRLSRYKETCPRGHQIALPPSKSRQKWLDIDWQFANSSCYRFLARLMSISSNFLFYLLWNVFYICAMNNRHILQCIMQCVQSTQRIVSCNTVRLIVKKVTSWDVISMALCGSFSVHTWY